MTIDQQVAATDHGEALATFNEVRRRLFGIAYRITGTASDAEDVVQETWIRWQTYDRSTIREPAAFLATTTTRLAINVLNSAHTRRETYIGPWLPAPVDTSADPSLGAERDEALHFATLMLMERLTPTERAAYVLREAFDYPYERIAAILESSEPAARKLVSRARRHLIAGAPRLAGRETHRSFLDAFIQAARTGDTARLENLLAEDAVSYTDGGGAVRHTARRPIYGRDRVIRFFVGLSQWFWDDIQIVPVEANGHPSVFLLQGANLIGVFTISATADSIGQILWMMNPAKLGAIAHRHPWRLAESVVRDSTAPAI